MPIDCQDILSKFDGKVVYDIGPSDRIHPGVLDVVEAMVGDDPKWAKHPQLVQYRQLRALRAKKEQSRNLRTEKEKLNSFLKAMKNRSIRARYASTRPQVSQ